MTADMTLKEAARSRSRAPWLRLLVFAASLATLPFTWTSCGGEAQTGFDLVAKEPGSSTLILLTALASVLLGVWAFRQRSLFARGALHIWAGVLAGIAFTTLQLEMTLTEWRPAAWIAAVATGLLVVDPALRVVAALRRLRPFSSASRLLMVGTGGITAVLALSLALGHDMGAAIGWTLSLAPLALPLLGLPLLEAARDRGRVAPVTALLFGVLLTTTSVLFAASAKIEMVSGLAGIAVALLATPWVLNAYRACPAA